ncbi:hypothetical protein EPD60_06695 [Flaviaesturariibacter flavus]|uniref:Uncharacterized protein n=1 Tax=Flaviaesturariibacter flavus TaxID=2502780 RepID=A0A4R1BKV8_9BACT|nr:hypothetical protein [Flaviaesturariibacter flavus]TCJ17868.1 hypothetical protein EPD60_06695 [Flaviaesturariibacter flavus]
MANLHGKNYLGKNIPAMSRFMKLLITMVLCVGCEESKTQMQLALREFEAGSKLFTRALHYQMMESDSMVAPAREARIHLLTAFAASGNDPQFALMLPNAYDLMGAHDSAYYWEKRFYELDSARGRSSREQAEGSFRSMAHSCLFLGDSVRLKYCLLRLRQLGPAPGGPNEGVWDGLNYIIFYSKSRASIALRAKGIKPCAFGLSMLDYFRTLYADRLADFDHSYPPEAISHAKKECAAAPNSSE